MCRLPDGVDFLVGDGVAMGGLVCGVHKCFSPPAPSRRFCRTHVAQEPMCAVVRLSSTRGPCTRPRAPRADNPLGEQQWLVWQEHIPLQEAHERRAFLAATRRNGSVVANDVADAVDQAEGDQFGAFGGGPSTGKLFVWARKHVQRYVVFSRTCGIVIFSEFLKRGEGPATVLASTAKALRCLPHPLSAVAYDMACRILQHIESGAADPLAAAAVEGVALVVLRFHERTHQRCGLHCRSSCRMAYHPELARQDGVESRFNSSVAEQHFRFLRGWKNVIHTMHCGKAEFILGCVEEERSFSLLSVPL